MKFLILLLYYDRPLLVRNALNSIKKTDRYFKNWHLAFIDDTSRMPGRPIVEEILHDNLDKVSFYYTDTSAEYKRNHGSLIGKFCNLAIQESDADYVLFLCDDDELHPEYLKKLNDFFITHPNCISAYSHVYTYNPAFERAENVKLSPHELSEIQYNRWTAPVRAAGRFDASQVAWPVSIHKQHNIWFRYPKTKNLDYDIYIQIYERFGKKAGRAQFTQLIAQYKSVTPVCLFVRDDAMNDFDLHGLERYTPLADIDAVIRRYIDTNKPEALRIVRKALSIHPQNPELLKKEKRLSTYLKKFSVIIASYGAKDMLEITVRSLMKVARDYIQTVFIIDSSHLEKAQIYQETVNKIKSLQAEFPEIHHFAYSRHNHGKKLDRMITDVNTPYTLISDSDVEYYSGDLFKNALESYEKDDRLFMIGNKQAEKKIKDQSFEASRLEPYCLFLRTDMAQNHVKNGYGFYRKDTLLRGKDSAGRNTKKRVFYDTASFMFHACLRKWNWQPIDPSLYRHLKHGSWYQHYKDRMSGLITETA